VLFRSKAISEEGPSSHNIKAGTPTMGGLLIFGAVAIVTIPTNLLERLSILLPLGVVLSGMIVGAIDDLGTLTERFRQRAALSWRLKFLYQLTLSAIVAGVLYFALEVQSINIPWIGQFELGLFYIPIAIGTVIATTTAVSITDGLDGLLGGTAAIAFGAYGVIAFIQGQLFLANFSFVEHFHTRAFTNGTRSTTIIIFTLVDDSVWIDIEVSYACSTMRLCHVFSFLRVISYRLRRLG